MASPLKPLPRRLFELLEEQQEPFVLHENGLSKRGFKSKGTFRCWSLDNHVFRKKSARARAGILRCFVTKLVYLKVIKKALNWERCKLAGCFSEMGSEANAADFHRLSSCSATREGELSGQIGWKEIEHSPVSVLELHSDEGSSDHNHSMEEGNQSTTSGFNSPTKAKAKAVVSIQPRQLLLDFLKEMEEKSCDPRELLGQKMSGNIMQAEIFPWEKPREGGDVAIFTQLLALDISETRREWTQFNAGREEIATEIGDIIFEEMREECVFDSLAFIVPWKHHDDDDGDADGDGDGDDCNYETISELG